jgi:hypothetical protein
MERVGFPFVGEPKRAVERPTRVRGDSDRGRAAPIGSLQAGNSNEPRERPGPGERGDKPEGRPQGRKPRSPPPRAASGADVTPARWGCRGPRPGRGMREARTPAGKAAPEGCSQCSSALSFCGSWLMSRRSPSAAPSASGNDARTRTQTTSGGPCRTALGSFTSSARSAGRGGLGSRRLSRMGTKATSLPEPA